MQAEQVTAPCAHHGEGPVWDTSVGALRWVDMLAGDVLTLGPDGAVTRLHVGDVAAALRPRREGGLVVAVERGFVLVDRDGEIGAVHEAFGDTEVRMNDGGCDGEGRFFCGSMAYDMSAGRGGLYKFEPDGSISRALNNVTVSNGISWDPSGRSLYYIDSSTNRVDAFDYEPSAGEMTNRRPAIVIPADAGMPDGMTVDCEGGLWVALWGGGAVHRYLPNGELDAVVELPVTQVTACAFGGPGLSELYISTSRMTVEDQDQPAAGALFRLEPGVSGLPVNAFAG